MPDSLNTRKKLLKTLQLTDYATLIEDINANFAVLLSSPLFLGLQGDPGENGSQGSPGIRGSKWLFASLDKFREQWPEDNLQGEYQITLDYLNKKLLSDEDRNKLLIATGAGELFVDGDTFVSNSKVFVLDLSNNKFIDTNNTLNNSSAAYQENLQKYIKQIVDETLVNNPVFMGLIQTVDAEPAQAKNYKDSSSNVNNQINESSMLDVNSTTAKPGTEISTHKMFMPSNKIFDDNDNLTYIIGSPEYYHQLIQKTLAYNEKDPSSNTISKYGPTYGNSPAVVILQNVNTNGVMIGYKNASKFTDFAKFYVNDKNEFVISSPNISDHYLKFSDIHLHHNYIDIFTDMLNVNGKVTFKQLVNISSLSSNQLNFTDKTIEVGNILTDVHLRGNKIYFDDMRQCNFLALSNENKLIPSPFDIDRTVDLNEISGSDAKLATTKLVTNLYEYVKSLHNTSQNIANRIEEVSKNIEQTSTYIEKRITSVNLNRTLLTGEIISLCVESNNESYDIVKTKMFDMMNIGRVNAKYRMNSLDYEVDLSSFKLCDGNNHTPKMVNYNDTDISEFYVLYLIKL